MFKLIFSVTCCILFMTVLLSFISPVVTHATSAGKPKSAATTSANFSASKQAPTANNMRSGDIISNNSAASTVSIVKDIVNILFFVVVGAIGILTYAQAKKSIFMPIRTETFKLQLKLFEDLFAFIEQNKDDSFVKTLDYRKILTMNAELLFGDYAASFFEKKIRMPSDRRMMILAEAPIINIAPQFRNKLKTTTDGLILDFTNSATITADQDNKLSSWGKYEYYAMHLTVHFQQQMDQLDKFIASPLLPDKIKTLVREFQVAAYRNIHLMSAVLTEAAKEMPSRYSSPELFLKAENSWIWNMFIQKRVSLEDLSNKIYNQINDYLNTDKIMKQ